MPNTVMITQESVDYANQLIFEVPKAYENIAQDTIQLLSVYQSNEQYLGPHKKEILEIVKTIQSAIKDQDDAILELKIVLRQYAIKAQAFLDNKPKIR